MNNPVRWKHFPPVLAQLALAMGLRPEPLWTYLASVLGGLGGPFAKIHGLLGEALDPSIPLILSVQHPGRARHLQQLALGPAINFNDWRRRHMAALDPVWYAEDLSSLSKGIRQYHAGLVELLQHPDGWGDDIAQHRRKLLEIRQNYQPSLLLSSPTPETFDKIRATVMDASPLITDPGGDVIRRCLYPGKDRQSWIDMMAKLVAGARGGFDETTANPASGPPSMGGALRQRTPFVIHLPHELAGLTLCDPHTANLLEVAVLIPTETIDTEFDPQNLADAKSALLRYHRAIEEVLWARTDNGGVNFSIERWSGEFGRGCRQLEEKIDSQPSEVRRLCGGLHDLPHRLLFAGLLLRDSSHRGVEDLVPGVLLTADWCVNQQISLIREALREQERRSLLDAAIAMVKKLEELPRPCKLSELLRKYHHQSKELHLPILTFLSEQGAIDWKPATNEIRLIELGGAGDWTKQLSTLAPVRSTPVAS
jgi:hypothetical protein